VTARVAAVVPAINEEATIARVAAELFTAGVDRVIVVDGGSRDSTAEAANAAGAEVVLEPRPGYGQACISGIRAAGLAECILFLDGDGSDDAPNARAIYQPVLDGAAHLVLGAPSSTGW
jgi:glycosyltransferase involved in cell wall biosynthesis